MIIDFLLRVLCVSAVISLPLLFFTLLVSGTAMAQSLQSWEQILAGAKKEGMVSVIGPQGSETRDALTLAFQKKYPDIRVELQSMAGNQIGPKLLNELAAGRNSTDVLITGTTTALETLLPAKALVAVKPWLSGPNTQDPSKWRGGKLTFSDEAQNYNLVFSAYVKAPFIYNSNLVSGADFKSWKDLLEPKWQGKIALKDPIGAGGGLGNSTLWYSHERLGKDFMRKIFALKDLVMPRDDRRRDELYGIDAVVGLLAEAPQSLSHVGGRRRVMPTRTRLSRSHDRKASSSNGTDAARVASETPRHDARRLPERRSRRLRIIT